MTDNNSNTNSKKYKHLSNQERFFIQIGRKNGHSISKIARDLGRDKSTISREIKKGTVDQMNTHLIVKRIYLADAGERVYINNRKNSGKKLKIPLVYDFLDYAKKKIIEDKWSPMAVVGRALREGKFTKSEMVCAKTLYRYIDNNLLSIRNYHLHLKLRRTNKTNKTNKHKRCYGMSIEERPQSVESREEFGHWEIDLVILKKKGSKAILTITERKTRKTVIKEVKDKSSESVEVELKNILNSYPELAFKTITSDNGTEFATLPTIFEETYYAHPYSSFERGTNERHNGLIRRMLPKGETLDDKPNNYIEKIEDYLNNYPREILVFATPNEMFQEELKKLT